MNQPRAISAPSPAPLSESSGPKGGVAARPALAIILPIYNEALNLPSVLEKLASVMEAMGKSYEIIAINDGSKDGTARLLDSMENPHLRVIHLRCNCGQTAALMAGFNYSRGEVIIAMDADGQNDPCDIPRLLEKLDEGFDVVSGWRAERKDAAIRRNLMSRVANWVISTASGLRLHDYGCTLKAYRREAMQGVQLYGEMHRFIPIYANWNGGRVAELAVQHHPRIHGKSNYGLERTVKVIYDMMVVLFLHHYGQKPMYIFGSCGILSFFISFVAGSAAVYYKFFGDKSFIQTPLPILVAIAFITGCMCILMGLLAELMTRTYHESQAKTTYLIARTRNFDETVKS